MKLFEYKQIGMDLDTVITKENIRSIITRDGIDQTTAKSIRHSLELQFELEQNDLKPYKHSIAKIIDDIIAEEYNSSDTETRLSSNENSKDATSDKTKSFTCTTRSGTECPKNIKNTQSKTSLTADEFLNSNKQLAIEIDGNTLTGNPRSFSSGNLGWYLTGKIEIDVKGHKVWAQVGMNVTIPGSQMWKQ